MRDITNHLHVVQAIAPAAAVADNTVLNSNWIDRSGYESLMFAIGLGGLADADATFAVTMLAANAADQSDAVAVTADKITGTLALAGFTFADDNKTRKVGYVGNRRYVRLVITPAANGAAAYITALAILGDSRFAPTPNPPA